VNIPTVYELDSVGIVLTAADGALVTPAQVEQVANEVMEELLQIEAESLGEVHSSAVSVSGTTGNVLLESGVTSVGPMLEIEFALNANSFEEASDIAQAALKKLHARLGRRRPTREIGGGAVLVETKRELEMLS
jgi:hypothetical protein